jgi:hypothetical protein
VYGLFSAPTKESYEPGSHAARQQGDCQKRYEKTDVAVGSAASGLWLASAFDL